MSFEQNLYLRLQREPIEFVLLCDNGWTSLTHCLPTTHLHTRPNAFHLSTMRADACVVKPCLYGQTRY